MSLLGLDRCEVVAVLERPTVVEPVDPLGGGDLKIVEGLPRPARLRQMDTEFTKQHYHDIADRHGQAVYDVLAAFIQQGPVVAMVLEGAEAVPNVRRIVGPTYPDLSRPGTIRGDFAHHSKAYTEAQHKAVANLVHASGNPEEAKYEVDLWFDESELFEYETLSERFTF